MALTAASYERLAPDFKARLAGLAGFIEKPFELAELSRQVSAQLSRLT